MSRDKVSLYLMTEKGLVFLDALIKNNLSGLIAHVTVGTDKNVQQDFSEKIIDLCNTHNLPWNFRKDRPDISTSYSIAVSWRWMLPINNKLIVFHDSLLPRYRGFAPLVSQLIEGETEIGATALFGSEEYDRGDIIAQVKRAITYPVTIQEAIQKILSLYAELAVAIVEKIHKGEIISGTLQNESQATYSLWRDEQDYYIDWTKDASLIERFINATGYPYTGAKSLLNNEEIIITKVKQEQDVLIHNRTPGKIIFIRQGKPVVVCGAGLLVIEEAYWKDSGTSILPFSKFRSRFHTIEN